MSVVEEMFGGERCSGEKTVLEQFIKGCPGRLRQVRFCMAAKCKLRSCLDEQYRTTRGRHEIVEGGATVPVQTPWHGLDTTIRQLVDELEVTK